MKKLLFFLLIFIGILLEATIINLPIVFNIVLIFYIFNKNSLVFLIAFISGVVLDILLINHVGLTSLLLVVFLFLIYLYERKFETKTINFVLFSSFIGSLVFLLVFKSTYLFMQAISSSVFSVLLFLIFNFFEKKKNIQELI